MVAKICMVLIFVGVAVGVGLYCRRTTSSVDGFVLGGRNVGPWMSAFAYGTSYFSAVVFVGYAGQFGWKYGIAAVWAGIGNAILGSLLAWWVLGPRTREMTHRLGATTMPEFFGKRFKSKGLRIASAAIIFVFLIPTPPACTTACRAYSAWHSACRTRYASSAWPLSPACTWCLAATWPRS
ncbi:MAG: hypothetical protein V8T51_07115 [Senegalimassilia faecalis]